METMNAMKMFLVDDDPFSLALYEQHVRNLGYDDVTSFTNGTDCLNNLVQQPDIIFLDHGMDTLNGVEVLRKIKRHDPNIFVVFVSGQEDIQTAVNSLKYGAFDYIVKGHNEQERFGKVIEKIIDVKDMMEKRQKSLLKKIFF